MGLPQMRFIHNWVLRTWVVCLFVFFFFEVSFDIVVPPGSYVLSVDEKLNLL
jgi:hypothetical protein